MKLTAKKSLSLVLVFGSILFAGFSFYVSSPPNSGTDENWSAKAAWYLSENPSHLFKPSKIISYQFPAELILDGKLHGKSANNPCWWDELNVQSKCQNLDLKDGFQYQNFDMVFRSPIYLFLVGKIMHLKTSLNSFEIAKLFSFFLNMLILFLCVLNMSRSSYGNKTPYLLLALSPSYYYLVGGVGPMALEISMALLLTTYLLRSNKLESNFKHEICIFATLAIFSFTRPLAGIWAITILWLYTKLFNALKNIKIYLLIIFTALLVQLQIDNSSWRFGDGSSYNVNTGVEFYVEELIRNMLGIGKWIWQAFALFQIGSSVELPLILLMIYIISLMFFLETTIKELPNKNAIRLVIIGSTVILPISIGLVFAGNWPGWWSGRYGMPFICSALLLLSAKQFKGDSNNLFLVTNIMVMFGSILNFSRWNWGLYPTYTPVIANGWSFGSIRSALYILSLIGYCLFITLVYKLKLKDAEFAK